MKYHYDILRGATKIKTIKKKIAKMPVLVAASITGALVLGGGAIFATVGGPTCTVGSGADYATIQSAVDVPTCSTIKVAAGSYNENVTITRGVTLKGAKAGHNPNGRTFGAANESTVSGAGASDTPAFTINAVNVTLDGFSITNPSHGIGVTVKAAGNNAVIKNNILDNIGAPDYDQNTVGVYLEYGPDNVRVSDNRISSVVSIPSAQGVLVGDSTSNDPSLNIRLVNNTISDVTSVNKGAYGIQVNNGGSSHAGFATVKILNNSIKSLTGGGWAHAIGLEGKTPNVVVKNNVVSNILDKNCVGEVSSPGGNICKFATITDQVAVWFEDNQFFFTADVNRNNLDVGSASYGIAVHPDLVTAYPTLNVDGSCNYWGAKSGPSAIASGSGSHVGAGIDYSPWLKNANLNGKCSDKNSHDWDMHDGDNDDYNHHHGYDD